MQDPTRDFPSRHSCFAHVTRLLLAVSGYNEVANSCAENLLCEHPKIITGYKDDVRSQLKLIAELAASSKNELEKLVSNSFATAPTQEFTCK
jgi:hypothetical protein